MGQELNWTRTKGLLHKKEGISSLSKARGSPSGRRKEGMIEVNSLCFCVWGRWVSESDGSLTENKPRKPHNKNAVEEPFSSKLSFSRTWESVRTGSWKALWAIISEWHVWRWRVKKDAPHPLSLGGEPCLLGGESLWVFDTKSGYKWGARIPTECFELMMRFRAKKEKKLWIKK